MVHVPWYRSKLPFLVGMILLACSSHLHAQKQPVKTTGNYIPKNGFRPNILWLVTEDISPYLACYGDSTASTPHLDRLAKEGVRFTNVYDVSGVCAPSRSAIITGMYPTYLGTNNMRNTKPCEELDLPKYSVVLPPEIKMFSELMRRGGYYCTNNGKEDYQFEALKAGWDENGNKAHYNHRPEGKPFFAVFNFNVTHESQIWQKKADPLLVDPGNVKLRPYYPESAVIRKDVARMYSNIMEMDQQVGKMLEELEASGLLEQTIIVFYSDNGGPLPRAKREVYNEGLRVPMLIRFPNKQLAGTVNNELISFVDLAPTMLSLAGIKIPDYMQGRSFLGTQKTSPPKYFFAARDRMDENVDMVRAVGDGQFKYIKNFHPEIPFMQNNAYRLHMNLMKELVRLNEEGKLNDVQKLWFRQTKPAEELYDTQNDPYELNNLAGDLKYAKKLSELRKALTGWMQMTHDKGFIPEKKFLETIWPNLVQPLTSEPVFKMSGNEVAISCSTLGNSISWQIVPAGKKPGNNAWQTYTGPVRLEKGQQLYALAERIGYRASEIKVVVLP
jgi:N-sulfoglucosamine sulfohydrolase